MAVHSDIGVVGAGIVGLALARHLHATRSGIRVTVLEKEPAVAQHQTGRNSGVVHAGLYSAPGSSLKARLCRRGVGLLKESTASWRHRAGTWCVAWSIPCRTRGSPSSACT